MRIVESDAATPVHAVKEGDRLRLRRTGEVREVVAIARTLTERALMFDDGTYIEAMILDTVFVTTEPVSPLEGASSGQT